MTGSSRSNYKYEIGGSLPSDAPSYVKRQADEELYQGLMNQEFCYVFNSRQMGKSSLRVRTMQKLQFNNIACAAIDVSPISTKNTKIEQWYAGVINDIVNSLSLYQSFDLDLWLEKNQKQAQVQLFSKFIEEVLLKKITQNLVIFVDEIDSILNLDFKVDDFFAVIRKCYNWRDDNPDYQRLTFALLGVATPQDLIQGTRSTPFNIGRAVKLTGFNLGEAKPLEEGLKATAENPTEVLKVVLDWTGGQPFLTQKMCKLISMEGPIPGGAEAQRVEQVVRSKAIENWQSQDNPEHLRTISDRILKSRYKLQLLQLYREILRRGEIRAEDESREQIELQLSGLVVKENGKLKVYNRIYREVFDERWVRERLGRLQPEESSSQPASLTKWMSATALVLFLIATGLLMSRRQEREEVSPPPSPPPTSTVFSPKPSPELSPDSSPEPPPEVCVRFSGSREEHINELRRMKENDGNNFLDRCQEKLNDLQFRHAIDKLAATDLDFVEAGKMLCEITDSYWQNKMEEPSFRQYFRDWSEVHDSFFFWIREGINEENCPAYPYLS